MNYRVLTEKPISILAAYYITVAAWVVGALWPQYRLWAFHWWAYYDSALQIVVLALFLVLPLVIWAFIRETDPIEPSSADQSSDKVWWVLAGVFSCMIAAMFWLLRTEIHFLGHGYTLLANLSEGNPTLKLRNFGEMAPRLWLGQILPGSPEDSALFSYRLVSIMGGILLLLTASWFSRLLFSNLRKRLFFLIGVCSGGYMLLFFGYVEHYSLFAWSVLLTCLTGIATARKRLNKWWIVLPFVAACVFHAAGLVLLPAVIYCLTSGTRLGDHAASYSRNAKLAIAAISGVGLLSLALYYYLTNLAFRLMIVPLVTDRFTIGEYTMFSLSHILDFANLVFLLIPGLLLTLALVLDTKSQGSKRSPVDVFLMIASVSALVSAFAFDPKIGMPRDWDLLSFAGAPFFVFLAYRLAMATATSRSALFAATLLVSLNFGILMPRALAMSHPSVGIQYIENYLALDVVRGRATMGVLYDFYQQQGRSDKVLEVESNWKSRYPETAINDSGMAFYAAGDAVNALRMFHQSLRHDPCNFSAYADAGMAFLAMKRYDSALAYLEIAYAMNSYNAAMLNNLANAYYFKGRIQDAQRTWERSLELDSTVLAARFSLANLYSQQGKIAESRKLFIEAAKSEDAPGYYITQLADMMTVRGEFAEAAKAYHRALKAGLDSAYVWQVIEQYPGLRSTMGW